MKKVLKVLAAIVLVIAIVFIGYLESGHYNADERAAEYVATNENDNYITYDKGSNVGFIFYPGGKVESSAYSYLSEIDANVYIAKFPFELAMFDYDIADEVIADNPQVDTWYIGGHSLGGVFANRFAVNNQELFSGVVFLGSYPAESDDSTLPGLAFFGDQDLVVGDYNEQLDKFGQSTEIKILTDGNHSGFGNYGQQKDDSELSTDLLIAQQEKIIDDINSFIKQ